MLKIMVKKTMRPIIFLEQKSKEVGLSNFTKKRYGIDTKMDSPYKVIDAEE